MRICLNEKNYYVEEKCTIFSLKERVKKDANVIIINGFLIKEDVELKENDRVIFIKKGEIPSKQELETFLVSRHTPNVQDKVKNATVGIAGLGGLGSNIAISLARIGIGKLVLVDFDVVEPSNLNRQQYFIRHIGMKKTEAIKQLLNEINPFVEVEVIDLYLNGENVIQCFENVNVVVEALDSAESKAEIVNAVLDKLIKTPIVTASGIAGYFSSNTIKTRRVSKKLYVVGDLISEDKVGCGLMAPRTVIAANHQANMVLRIILGEHEA